MATRAKAQQPAKSGTEKRKSPRKKAATRKTTAKATAAKRDASNKVTAKKVAPENVAAVKKTTTKRTPSHALRTLPRGVALKKIRAGLHPLQAAKELSGASWVAKFPGSNKVSDLADPFKANVTSFISAMTTAQAAVTVSSTYRPPERLYLMHWSWKLSRGEVKPADIPAMVGVEIEWNHGDEAASRAAAKAMVTGYQIVKEPSLTSRHSQKKAIDMTIAWTGNLTIKNKSGMEVTISTVPRNGENEDLIAVGKTFSVIKATFAGDPPHWSTDGA